MSLKHTARRTSRGDGKHPPMRIRVKEGSPSAEAVFQGALRYTDKNNKSLIHKNHNLKAYLQLNNMYNRN